MADSIDITKIAQLSNLTLDLKEAATLKSQFKATLKVVDQLNQLDTSKLEATPQVTGLENRLREDVVDLSRCLSQKQALQNATNTHQGYFVVSALIES
jgi:aspartyl/glutamyl-tRNA(Asn/Gln) amidotransferase C subunit